MRVLAWFWNRWEVATGSVTVPRFIYTMGHAAIGIIAAVVTLAVSLWAGWVEPGSLAIDRALAVGSVGYPLLKETWDYIDHAVIHKDTTQGAIAAAKDGLADLIQHQLLLWPLAHLAQQATADALLSAAMWWGLYVITLPWSESFP